MHEWRIIKECVHKFPGGPVVRTWHFHFQDPSWIPDWETKILQDTQPKRKKERLFLFAFGIIEKVYLLSRHLGFKF